jgi:hypothetical protein
MKANIYSVLVMELKKDNDIVYIWADWTKYNDSKDFITEAKEFIKRLNYE